MSVLRDWGYIKDYLPMQLIMLQQDKAHDYVIAAGKQYSMREIIIWTVNTIWIDMNL